MVIVKKEALSRSLQMSAPLLKVWEAIFSGRTSSLMVAYTPCQFESPALGEDTVVKNKL